MGRTTNKRLGKKGELRRSVLWTLAIALFAITAGHEILVKRADQDSSITPGESLRAEMGPFTAWFRRAIEEPEDDSDEEEEKATACIPRSRSAACGQKAFQPSAPFGPQR